MRGGVGTYTWSGSKAQAPSPKPHIILPTLEEAMPVTHFKGKLVRRETKGRA